LIGAAPRMPGAMSGTGVMPGTHCGELRVCSAGDLPSSIVCPRHESTAFATKCRPAHLGQNFCFLFGRTGPFDAATLAKVSHARFVCIKFNTVVDEIVRLD